MVVIFAGSLLANLIMGEPMLSPFKNNNQLLLATAVWYASNSHIDLTYFNCNYRDRYVIFYLPFDLGYKFFKFLPVKIVCAALKEVYRYAHITFRLKKVIRFE